MKIASCTLTALLFTLVSPAHSAVITISGSIEGPRVQDWLTASTLKGAADIDGDNIFGSSLGAVHWGNFGKNEKAANEGVLGWSYRSDSGQYGGDARYPLIDSLRNPAIKEFAGIGGIGNPIGTFVFGLEGTAADYLGKTVRVGVMADVLGSDERGADTNKTYRLTGPGGADSGPVSLRGGAAGDSVPEMYFFDITGVNPGDVYTLSAANTGGSGLAGYIGPVSWDIASVPEPGTVIFGVIGLGTLLGRRRRARA